MNQTAGQFFEFCSSRKIAFIGAGVSHNDCIRLFRKKGIPVLLCDKKEKEQLGPIAEELEALGVTLKLGPDYLKNLEQEADIVFRAPGMYFLNPELIALRQKGLTVTSELEVFFDLCPCPIFAVTGSDGKTTTTTLIGKFLESMGKKVHLGGNIGKALLPEIESVHPEDVAVVELSSFQLISMRRSPDVAVITNVAPNHLDVHKNFEEYIDSKRNLYRHQNAFSRTVLNADNEITASMASEVRGQLCWFSSNKPVERGCYLQGEEILLCYNGKTEKVMKVSDIRIPGWHNVENYMTAIAATAGWVTFDNIRKIAREFNGVEHRIELVREKDGIKWYNDSIASSPTRTIAGLRSFKQKVILIAGGYDKKIPYAPLGPAVVEKVQALILMGKTADKIQQAVEAAPGFDPSSLPILRVANMEEGVRAAQEIAKPGDIVTMSPASASFDLYRNFEERGKHFKKLVMEL